MENNPKTSCKEEAIHKSSRIDQIESDISDLKNLVKGILIRLDDVISSKSSGDTLTSSTTPSSSSTVIKSNHVTSHFGGYHDFMSSPTDGGEMVSTNDHPNNVKPPMSTDRSVNYVALIKTQLEREIASIQNQKSEVMESMKHDERLGEEFEQKLKSLKSSLERYKMSQQQQQHGGQQSTTTAATTSQFTSKRGVPPIVIDEKKIIEKMKLLEDEKEKHLGTSTDMNLKKEERMLQVRHHKNNLADLQSSLCLLMETFGSTLTNKSADSNSTNSQENQPNQAAEADFGICIQHNMYNIGSSSFIDVTTQTAHTAPYSDCDVIQDNFLNDDSVNNTPPPEAAESRLHGVTLLSRFTQTKVSSFTPTSPLQQSEENNKNNKNLFDKVVNIKQEFLPNGGGQQTAGAGGIMTSSKSVESAAANQKSSNSSSLASSANERAWKRFGKDVKLSSTVVRLFPQLGTREERNVLSLAVNVLSRSPSSCMFLVRASDTIDILVELIYGDDGILPSADDVTALPTPTSFEIWATTRRRALETIFNIVKTKGEERKMEVHTITLLNEVRLYGEHMLRTAIQTNKHNSSYNSPSFKSTFHIDRIVNALRGICHFLFNSTSYALLRDMGGVVCLAQAVVISSCVYKMTQQNNLQKNNKIDNLQQLLVQTLYQVSNKFTSPQQTSRLLRMKGFVETMQRELNSGPEKSKPAMMMILHSLCERCPDMAERQVLQDNKLLVEPVIKYATQCSGNQLKPPLLTLLYLSHSTENRLHICQYHGAIRFIVSLLSFPPTTNIQKVTEVGEIGCGILRNLSLIIAVNENYCEILRSQYLMKTLLRHLRSTNSSNHVTNVCAIISNLTTRNDMEHGNLRSLGGYAILRDLAANCKHRNIAYSCAQTLQHLTNNTSSSVTSASSSSSKSVNSPNRDEKDAKQQNQTPSNVKNNGVVGFNMNNHHHPTPTSIRHLKQKQNRFATTNKPTTATKQQTINNNPTAPTIKNNFTTTKPFNGYAGPGSSAMAGPEVTQMPDNLLQKLRDIDVCGGQDDVVDFSLKFSDQTPPPQLPPAAVAKVDKKPTAASPPTWSSPAAGASSGKPSSVVGKTTKSSVVQHLHSLEENFHPTEMPTNFGALYNEVTPSTNPPAPVPSTFRATAAHHHHHPEERTPANNNAALDSGAVTPASHYNYRLPSTGRRSGTRTPHTPMYQETPLVYSRTSPVSSLQSEMEDGIGFDSDVTSNPLSHMSSESVSPSDLPDSPFEPMPPPKALQHAPPPPEGDKETSIAEGCEKIVAHVIDVKQKSVDASARDEIKCLGGGATATSNGDVSAAMSVVTSLSGLTIDGAARAQVLGVDKPTPGAPPSSRGGKLVHQQLGCNDELKVYTSEGDFSPLSGLSIISGLVEEEERVDSFIHKLAPQASVTSQQQDASSTATSQQQQQQVMVTSAHTSTSTVVENVVAGAVDTSHKDDVVEDGGGDDVGDCASDDSSLSFSSLDQDQGLLEEAIKCGFPRKSSHNRSSKQQKNKTTENKTTPATTTEKKSTTTTTSNNYRHNSNAAKSTNNSPTQQQQQQQTTNAVNNKPTRKVENGRNIIDYMEGIMATGDKPSTAPSGDEQQEQYHHLAAGNNSRTRVVQYDTEQQVKTYSVTKAHRRDKKVVTSSSSSKTAPPSDEMVEGAPVAPPQVYAVEGTPMELSRSTSLSNITIESEKFEFAGLKTILSDRQGEVPVVAPQPPQQQRRDVKAPMSGGGSRFAGYYQSLPSADEIHTYNSEGSIGARTTFSHLNNDPTAATSSGIHHQQPAAPAVVCAAVVATSDAPVMTSSSLSSSSGNSSGAMTSLSRNQFVRLSTCKEDEDEVQEIRTPINDRVFNFQVEDTPMLFSDNSSLSSLEIDDAADMDLLNDCISSAMPVAKIDPNQTKPSQYNPTPPPSNNRAQPQQQQVTITQQQQQQQPICSLASTSVDKQQATVVPVDGLPSTSAADNRHYQQLQTSNLLNNNKVCNSSNNHNADDDLYELSSAKSDELGLGGCAQTLMRDQQKKQQLQREKKELRDISRHKSANERRKMYRSAGATGGGKSGHYTSKEFSASSGSSNNIQPRTLRGGQQRPNDGGPCQRCAEANHYAAASTGHMTDNVQAKTPRHRRRRRTASAAHHPRYPMSKYNHQYQMTTGNSNNSPVYYDQQPTTSSRAKSSSRNGSGRHGNFHQPPQLHHHHHGASCGGSSLVKIFPSLPDNHQHHHGDGGGSDDDVMYANEHDAAVYHQPHPLHHAPSSGHHQVHPNNNSSNGHTPPPPQLSGATCRPSLVGKKSVLKTAAAEEGVVTSQQKQQGKKKKGGGGGGSKEGLSTAATSSGKNLWKGLKKMLSINDDHDGGKKKGEKQQQQQKKKKKSGATADAQVTHARHDSSSLSLSSSDDQQTPPPEPAAIHHQHQYLTHHQSNSNNGGSATICHSSSSYSRSPCCSAKLQRPHADVCPLAGCPLEGAAVVGRSRSTSSSSKFSHKSSHHQPPQSQHHRKTSSSSRGGTVGDYHSSRVSVRSHTSDDRMSRDQMFNPTL